MCKGKKVSSGTGAPIANAPAADPQVPVFMDCANDGETDDLIEIYRKSKNKKSLLTAKNGNWSTALHLACNNGHADIVEYLVQRIVEDCNDMAH